VGTGVGAGVGAGVGEGVGERTVWVAPGVRVGWSECASGVDAIAMAPQAKAIRERTERAAPTRIRLHDVVMVFDIRSRRSLWMVAPRFKVNFGEFPA
jgi:hypothetical protein